MSYRLPTEKSPRKNSEVLAPLIAKKKSTYWLTYVWFQEKETLNIKKILKGENKAPNHHF